MGIGGRKEEEAEEINYCALSAAASCIWVHSPKEWCGQTRNVHILSTLLLGTSKFSGLEKSM